MKEAQVHIQDGNITVKIVDTLLPQIKPNQVLIKVAVSGSNPKDWKTPGWFPDFNGTNTGDDIAGIVQAVGSKVTDFKAGDKVAAFHELRTPGGSFAEYAVAYEHATFTLPANTSFEEGAAIPLAAMTAAVGLFCRLGLPEPWVKTQAEREKAKGGIVVYGAASAVGAYAIKFLQKTNIHPIIAVAGRGKDFVEKLIDRSKGDTIVDYRDGDEKVVQGLKDAVKTGEKLSYAFDAVGEHSSHSNIAKAIDPHGHITTVLLVKDKTGIPDTVHFSQTMVSSVHGADKEFGCAWFRLFSLGLKDGWFSGHPTETIPGGLAGVEQGLKNLQGGKASGVKYVFKIDDTEGVGKSVLQGNMLEQQNTDIQDN